VLTRIDRPHVICRVADLPASAGWVAHVVASVRAQASVELGPMTTQVFTANREVDALWRAAGYTVVSQEVTGPTPHELIEQIVRGEPWEALAAPEMQALYTARQVVPRLRAIYAEQLLTEDGELGHARDFASYGAQMDAALEQKLADLGPWILPGKIVDKGCGTGKLLVELSRAYADSAFIGVDLSRELLRRCDENHYFAEDVTLVQANIIERQVAPGTATSILYSSVVHEIYSYSGYDSEAVHRALANAAIELKAGGRVLVRDGVSPGLARWRMHLLDEGTRAQFARFAAEFKHGQGAAHERGAEGEVFLSAHLCNEFLCKKDYQKNWHIEAHEEYGTFTVEQWRAALDRAGFDALEIRAYVNAWIAEHRYEGKVELYDERGTRLPWPATNVVVVGARR
jgi:SAM-dependent methyltransferase